MKKVAILYSHLSGYTAACQRALKERAGAELLVVHWPIAAEAPFSERVFGHIDHRYNREQLDTKGIIRLVDDFSPDVLLISGWMDRAYLAAAKDQKKRGIPVVAGSDTQWNGSLRQKVAQLIAPWYLHPSIDIMWVTGERQRLLAEKLGYTAGHCWTGYYACDWQTFAQEPEHPKENAFLFTGRYIERKGLRSLLDAYQAYRQKSSTPWQLWTVGTGDWSVEIQKIPGAKDWGFVQPEELPGLMKRASAFILPSLYEPWGVALHEAAAASLPLLASQACGAAVHLLRDGFNGYTFAPDNSRQLMEKMSYLSSLPTTTLQQYGTNSLTLSKQYTPQLWAETIITNLGWN